MAPEPAVAKAIEALNGRSLAERKLKVARAPALPKRAPRPLQPMAPARSPERIAEAIRKFRAGSPDAANPTPVPAVPVRQVVVEYRKTRRFEIPPRAAVAARG